jgi:hypothetical protein
MSLVEPYQDIDININFLEKLGFSSFRYALYASPHVCIAMQQNGLQRVSVAVCAVTSERSR